MKTVNSFCTLISRSFLGKTRFKKAENKKKPMKFIVRAALGFIGGVLTLYGIQNVLANQIMGIVLIIAGIGFFVYGYKGD